MNTSAPDSSPITPTPAAPPDVFTAQFSASHAAFLITYLLAGVTATHGAAGPATLLTVALTGLTCAALAWHTPSALARPTSGHPPPRLL